MKGRASQRQFEWLMEALEQEASFLRKPMFGCEACYLHGRLALVLAAKREPWNGVLVCTSQEHHSVLIEQNPLLRPHPILGKWLYLAQAQEGFEEAARRLIDQARKNDLRIGVEPKGKRRRRAVRASD